MAGKLKILIVENETPVAMMMVFALTRVGCDVDAVHTGKRGLALAREQRFDLITMDTKLPDADGLELCSELRQRHISRKTPVIFISGNPSPEDMAKGKKYGAVDCIAKPVEITDFIYRVIFHARANSIRTETGV